MHSLGSEPLVSSGCCVLQIKKLSLGTAALWAKEILKTSFCEASGGGRNNSSRQKNASVSKIKI